VEEIVYLVANLGFPVAISVYLLMRFDGLIKQLVLSQEKLIVTVEKLYLLKHDSREVMLNDRRKTP